MSRTICVSGGRASRIYMNQALWLKEICEYFDVDRLIHGAADGIDEDAGDFAEIMGYAVTEFPVNSHDWNVHGKRAGSLRNRRMADEADVFVLFPGGSGTADMKRQILVVGKPYFDWREHQDWRGRVIDIEGVLADASR